MMLPNTIDNDARDERSGAVFHVSHPLRQSATLLRGVVAAGTSPRGRPIVGRRFSPAEHSQKTQLDRLAFFPEIAAGQKPPFAWVRTQIGEAERGWQCFWLTSFGGLECFFACVPLATLPIRKKWAQILVLDFEVVCKPLHQLLCWRIFL